MVLSYFLSLMVIIRDEEMNIREFVEHYVAEQVEHFYIIDDNSQDNFRNVLADFDPKLFTILRIDENLRSAGSMQPQAISVVPPLRAGQRQKDLKLGDVLSKDQINRGKGKRLLQQPDGRNDFDDSEEVDDHFVDENVDPRPYPAISFLERHTNTKIRELSFADLDFHDEAGAVSNSSSSASASAQWSGQTGLYTSLLNVFRNETEWVLVVDCDEYMHSRRRPDMSVAGVLKTYFPHHDAMIVPELLYAWYVFSISAFIFCSYSVESNLYHLRGFGQINGPGFGICCDSVRFKSHHFFIFNVEKQGQASCGSVINPSRSDLALGLQPRTRPRQPGQHQPQKHPLLHGQGSFQGQIRVSSRFCDQAEHPHCAAQGQFQRARSQPRNLEPKQRFLDLRPFSVIRLQRNPDSTVVAGLQPLSHDKLGEVATKSSPRQP